MLRCGQNWKCCHIEPCGKNSVTNLIKLSSTSFFLHMESIYIVFKSAYFQKFFKILQNGALVTIALFFDSPCISNYDLVDFWLHGELLLRGCWSRLLAVIFFRLHISPEHINGITEVVILYSWDFKKHIPVQILVHYGKVFHSWVTVLIWEHWKGTVLDSMLVLSMYWKIKSIKTHELSIFQKSSLSKMFFKTESQMMCLF